MPLVGVLVDHSHSSMNIPINCYHPMALSLTFASSNIADLLIKSLPISTHHRCSRLFIGDIPTTPTTSVVKAAVDSMATVDPAAAVASLVPSMPTATPTSNSVPTLPVAGPTPASIVLDTGATLSIAPFASELLPQASGSVSSTSNSKAASIASLDPCVLITGEDAAFSVDFSSADSDSVLDFGSELATAGTLEFREFGTATPVLHYTGLNAIHMSVESDLDRLDWLQWVPLPRLTPPESCYHIFGLT